MDRDSVPSSYIHDTFISYRRSDGSRAAHWLRRSLLRYRLPSALKGRLQPSKNPNHKLDIYIDTIYERATDDFYEKNIRPALQGSEYLIVIVSPDVSKQRVDGSANWVQREIEDFLALPQGNNVLVASTTGEKEVQIPEALRNRFPNLEIINLQRLSILRFFWWPVRWHLRNELVKVVAALHRVPGKLMPVLREEEKRHQRRNLSWISLVSTVLLLIMTILAVVAVIQSGQAHTQKLAAESSAEEARRQQLAAERSFRQSQESLANSLVMLAREARNQKDYFSGMLYLAAAQQAHYTPKLIAEALALEPSLFNPGHIFQGLASSYYPLAVSPSGEYIAFVGLDSTVVVAEVHTGKEILHLGPHEGHVSSMAFSPDGSVLAVATYRTEGRFRLQYGSSGVGIYLWDMNTKERVGLLHAVNYFSAVRDVAFRYPDGKLLAATLGSHLMLWDVDTGEDLAGRQLEGPGYASSLAFSHDGKWMAASFLPSTFAEASIRMWDVETRQLVASATVASTYRGRYTRRISTDLAFSPDDKMLAAGPPGSAVHLFQTPNLEQRDAHDIHNGFINSLIYLGGSDYILSASRDRTLRMIDARTGAVVGTNTSQASEIGRLASSKDGTVVAASDRAGNIHLWHMHASDVGVKLGPDRHVLFGFRFDGKALFTTPHDSRFYTYNPVFSADQNGMRLIHEETGEPIDLPDPIGDLILPIPSTPVAQKGRFIFSFTADSTVAIWDLKTQQKLDEPSLLGLPITSFAIDPDGNTLAYAVTREGISRAGHLLGEVQVRDLKRGVFLPVLDYTEDWVTALTFSSDGALLAASSVSGKATLWDTKTWNQQRVIERQIGIGVPIEVQFAPVDNFLIGTNRTNQVWLADLRELESAQFEAVITSERGDIYVTAFHPDGRVLVAASMDGTIHLFDMATRTMLLEFQPKQGEIRSLSFRADGRVLAVGYSDGETHFLGSFAAASLEDAALRTNLELDLNSLDVKPQATRRTVVTQTALTRLPLQSSEVEFWKIFSETRNAIAQNRRGERISDKDLNVLRLRLQNWAQNHSNTGLALIALGQTDCLESLLSARKGGEPEGLTRVCK